MMRIDGAGRVLRVLALIAIAVLSGAGSVPAAQPYTIPLILDLTGSNAFVGNDYADTAHAFEHWVNEHGGIHGTPIHFDIRDSETSPQIAVQLATQFIAQHPAVITGPSQVGQCAAVAPLTTAGPVDYCFSPGYSPKAGSYNFASSVSLAYIQPAMMRYARLKGYRRLGMIETIDATGQANGDATVEAIARPENKGLQIVTTQHFSPGDTTVSAQVADLKAAHPDAIIVWANGTAFGTVLRNLKDAGVDVPVITTGANLNQRVMAQFKNVLPTTLLFNGIVYYGRENLRPGPLRTRIDDFYRAFKEVGKTPTPSSGYAWDPCLIITDALRHLGTNATAAQLHDYLVHLRGFVGISGVYDFSIDQHGLTDKSVIMVKWDADKSTFVAVSRGGGIPL